ncbi:MAG: bifunctional 2-polyprenyl-6-hydroxyphenol methylase/3-demethylubiquinol 3-O-methyltransferase UbiG [Devosia sp.]
MANTTINADEVDKFSRLADEWWDPKGQFKALHRLNPARLGYIRDQALAHFGRDGGVRRPLEGLSVLDIGCGGGLLSEPLARLGAAVTGIDAAGRNVAVARLHAEQAGVAVDYQEITAEALLEGGSRFDIVLAMEVIEHVENVPLFMKSCAGLVAPGGLLFIATINRTLRALALAIYGAEYVLRWIPRGTHQYEKFLTPEEVRALATRNGLRIVDQTGVVFHPMADEWRLSPDMGINYMVLAEKPEG